MNELAERSIIKPNNGALSFSINDDYSLADELANALGVTVKAPNDVLYISEHGILKVGNSGEGKMIAYSPNQRERRK